MPSTDQILALILKNEGGYTNHPADTGGETHYGISRTAHPEAWVDGTVSQEAARAIYLTQYVTYPKFDQIPDPYLMMQLVDFGVHSGPGLAIMKLQGILGVTVDGILGPETFGTMAQRDPRDINNRLAVERAKMLGRIVIRDKSQIAFLSGWLNRALSYIR